MGEKVQEWLLGVITGDKSRIIWVIVIVLFFLAVIVYPYIDANFLYYDRIEKRIDNLQRLIALSGETLEDNDDLRAEYCSILGEIEEARAKTLSSATVAKDSTEEKQLKFIGGALLFAIVGVYMFFQHKKGEKFTIKKFISSNIPAAILCVLIAIPLGHIFTLFPTLGSVWINFFSAPILELVVLWLLIGTSKKKDSSSANVKSISSLQ